MLDTIKSRLKEAIKSGNEVEKSILRVLIGEVDRLNSPTDQDITKVARKLIIANQETLAALNGEASDRVFNLIKENLILNSFLPQVLDREQIKVKLSHLVDNIKSAKSDGQAMGIGMKFLKSEKLEVSGEDVAAVIKGLRS